MSLLAALVLASCAAGAARADAMGSAFDSGSVSPGASFSWIAGATGDIAYHCHYHPNMTASLHVADGDGMGSSATVDMRAFMFAPANLTVAKGTNITWVNHDSIAHDVMSGTGMDSGTEMSNSTPMPNSTPMASSSSGSMSPAPAPLQRTGTTATPLPVAVALLAVLAAAAVARRSRRRSGP